MILSIKKKTHFLITEIQIATGDSRNSGFILASSHEPFPTHALELRKMILLKMIEDNKDLVLSHWRIKDEILEETLKATPILYLADDLELRSKDSGCILEVKQPESFSKEDFEKMKKYAFVTLDL